MRVAIPRMGESVAPCFEYCATMALFTISGSAVTDQIDFPLHSREPFDRVRLLRDQKIDTIIASPDIVAADSYASTLFGLRPDDLAYVQAGAAMGLGRSDLESLTIEEIAVGS